ncbi:MAG: family 20 glycosylhydrolase [Bacteroidales bacterium]
MKITIRLIMAILAGIMLNACTESIPANLENNSIIPKPLTVIASGGSMEISKRTRILYSSDNQELMLLANQMNDFLNVYTGVQHKIQLNEKGPKSRSIFLELLDGGPSSSEEYRLAISEKQVVLSSPSAEGIFRGIQTFRQLILLEGPEVMKTEGTIRIPTGVIEDYPEYEYRGTMLDVSRHFFGPDIVKTHIDLLALYKINVLHLHLSDDQGWRIEIKSWPKLTEIGGSTEVGGGEGGYYTQEEYKDIVNYAAERYITIVPEIDMPGHTNAALASYAELNCDGKATSLYTGTRVGFSTLCTHKEITYKFVDDVVREISGMSPGPYFHIGGDESHVTALPDYIYFIDSVRQIVKSHGKIMVGWDEISHAGLEEGDVAQYWASSENALRAVEKGAKLIISPAKQCYLDMKYDSTTRLGLNWAAFIEVDDAYTWDPVKLVDGIGREHILGVESPLWGETIETIDDIGYLAFPRLIGHAEIGWSRADSLLWDEYRNRLSVHGKLLDKFGVNYYRSGLVDWMD